MARPASVRGRKQQSSIDRVGAQRIADCGDYRMAEVMPTNCLWRASRGCLWRASRGFALYDLGEDGVKCVAFALASAGEGSGRGSERGEQQQSIAISPQKAACSPPESLRRPSCTPIGRRSQRGSTATAEKLKAAKKERRDQPGVRQERTRVPYFFLPFFFFLSFFLDLSFFGCSIVPVHLGEPQRHSQIFFSSLVCFSSRRMP